MRTIQFLFVVLFSIALASCGGGGGGSTPTPTTHKISGTVAGAANVTINLTGAASKTTTTDASGNYSFTGLANGIYTITPSLSGHVFTPTSIAVNVAGASVTGMSPTATASTAPTYCLSGTVSGAVVQNVTVTLNGANTGSTVTDANGKYSFCGLVSGNYTVTPSLAGYSFTTTSTITIGAADVPANDFTVVVAPSGSSVVFLTVNPLPQTTVGTAYTNSVIASISGGSAPYHYQSDSFATGAPPIGMIVDLNGNLTGTPRVAGTYTFGVCAVDLVGASSCKTTSIIVSSTLAVSLAGSGSGTVTSSSGGINCGSTCAANFTATNSLVTLTATAAAGSTFSGWSGGGCSGTGTCIVTMNANQAVTATFIGSAPLTGTWTGTWAWSGPGSNGCQFSDGGAFSMTLTQSGTSFSGSTSGDGIQWRWDNTCVLGSTTSGTGSASGTISGTALSLSFDVGGLYMTGTATLNVNTLTASFVRDTGGSGSFTVTKQ